jgi:hypothetical protein
MNTTAQPDASTATKPRVFLVPYFSGLVVALLLLASARVHVLNPYRLQDSILNYRLLPFWAATVLAAFLPYLQLCCAVALIAIPKLRRTAALVSAVMFVVFITAQSTALARGLDISCGFFGTETSRVGWKTITVAVLGLLASIVGGMRILERVHSPNQELNTPARPSAHE